MLQLLLGRAGSGKTDALLHTISVSYRTRPQLLIVPEQHSHDTERRLCAAAGNAVSLNAEVLSFTRLASRVFSVTGGLAEPTLDAGGRFLLMDVALKQVAGQLRLYGRPSRKPEFLSRLCATIDECKTSGITPDQLAEVAAQTQGETADKLWDLSLICGAYDALTGAWGADPRDRLTKLAAALQTSRWAEGQDIYLDAFTDFTPQERLVLRQLFQQAHSVTIALTCDSLDSREEIFTPARRTAFQLLALARESGIQARTVFQTPPTAARPRMEPGQPLLLEAFWGPMASSDGLELYQAESPFSEVERAAAEIVSLVRTRGYRWRDIQVTARTLDNGPYASLIAQLFPRYGIPIFLSRMDDILQKPILLLVVSALNIAAGDYAYEDVFRCLKTGLAGLALSEVDELENYALKWKIRGPKWHQKAAWAMHPEGYGLPWTDAHRAQVEHLDALRRRFVEPLERLRKCSDRTGEGLTLALYRFLEDLELADRLTERAGELQEAGEPALAQEYQQLWDILCGALTQCASLLGRVPMEWDEFARLFQLVLSQYDVGAIPASLDQVTVGDMRRLAHRHCKILFVLGADDSNIPAVSPSPGLFADADREILAQFGLETAPERAEKLWRELTVVYETCSLPTVRLVVSYPAVGTQGEEQRPSFLFKRLRQAFPDLLLQRERGDDFRLAAPRPALEAAGRQSQAAEALKAIPEYAPLVTRLERAQNMERGSLTRPSVEALYGVRVPMSASRMDRYQSCHFSYFMQYGLKARPRKAAGFQAPEYGTFIHYVLEHTLKRRKGKKVPSRAEVSAVIQRYVDEELGGLKEETPRFRYLFRRLEKTVYAVVENVFQELARSDFEPLALELGFGSGKENALPPVEFTVDGVTISVSGLVDRVDGFEKNGRLYLRVVDYKTGRKSFDLTDVWNGLGLQMLLYLFTLKKAGKNLFGGKEVVPAGVLYLPAREAVVAGSREMPEDARQAAVDSALRRKGLLLSDPDILEAMEHTDHGPPRFLPVKVNRAGVFTGEALVNAERLGKLEKHTEGILQNIAAELAAGNIAADPFWKGPDENACQWCDYVEACQFRDGCGGDRRRFLPTVKADAFWEALERREETKSL